MGQIIARVDRYSIAEELEIAPGDELLTINGERIIDLIDYEALCALEELTLTVKKPDGTVMEAEIEKDAYEPLGLNFETDLMGPLRCCANHCIFCFVDQMRPGLRKSLYVKDDDWRMSMIMGNFVTLTNVTDKELDRIIRRKASPLYISVHATDPELRACMMKQPLAAKLMEQLKKLTQAGIKLHCQMVLCPGYNDGAQLERSIADLYSLGENVLSLAAVPVGLTGYRDELHPLKGFDKAGAEAVIDCADRWRERAQRERGHCFVYPSDEFYVLAERPLPDYDSYNDFPQIENGVGILRKFHDEVEQALQNVEQDCLKGVSVTMVNGTSAQNWAKELGEMIARKTGADIRNVTVVNKFFGDTVTVTGLLVEQDVEEELKRHELGDFVMIPRTMLREGTEVFLDGGTVTQLSEAIGVPVRPFYCDGEELIDVLLGREPEEF